MPVLITIGLCLCIASAFNYFKTRQQRALITNIKGPVTLPLIGSLHRVFFLKPNNFFEKSKKYIEDFGTFSRCWVFDRLFIPTSNYELVLQLLNSTDHLNTGYNVMKPWHGSSLIGKESQDWEKRRLMINHVFQDEMLDHFMEIFVNHGNALIEHLRQYASSREIFDAYEPIYKTVLDITLDAIVGTKARVQFEEATYVKDLSKMYMDRFLSLESANNIIYTVTSFRQKKRQRKLIESINQIHYELIKQSRAAKEPKKGIYAIEMPDNVEKNSIVQTHSSLLDMLSEANIEGVELTDAEISEELNNFIYQSSLPTSSAIAFALVQIARHPSVQQKLYEEMQTILSRDIKQKLTIKHLNQLPYLECVIKETLRLFPPQPLIGRELNKNFEYSHKEVGNGILPEKSEIFINIFEMLRDPEKIENPLNFNPERYLDKTSSPCDTNLLFYSLGPRNCIGQHFAMLQMKTIIAKLLRVYEILPFGDEIRLEIKFVLTSLNGFQVALKERE